MKQKEESMKSIKMVRSVGIILVLSIIIFTFPCAFAQSPPTQVIKWKYQSFMPTASLTFKEDQYLCELIKKATNGRLEITPFAGGALASLYDTFEAVSKGAIQIAHAYGTAYSGKIKEAGMIKEQPYGIQRMETYYRLINSHGWRSIFADLMKPHGVRLQSMFIYPGYEPLRLRKSIKSIKDFKGMKLRMGSGIGPFYQEYLGANIVQVAGAELYTAMQLGTIDGLEFASGLMDWDWKFHEVAPYIVYPGWDGPCEEDIIVNQAAYDKLPEDVKVILDQTIENWTMRFWLLYYNGDIKATNDMVKYGNKIINISPDEVVQLKKWAKEWRIKAAAKISPTMVKLIDIYERLYDDEEAIIWGSKPKNP
jgi:TRAP-type mannitol/chloroaromatic compound transport system substrate-binding protein